jgi:hypothetical protein
VKLLCFHLRNQLDPERVDVVEVREGALLVDSAASGKWSPLISVSYLERVEFVDDSAAEPASNRVAPCKSRSRRPRGGSTEGETDDV